MTLTNGLVTVAVDAGRGTFSVDGREGYGHLVDGGDLGDSYNYSPPRQDTLIDEPVEVAVRVVEPGPVRATLEITATYVLARSRGRVVTAAGRASTASRSRPGSSSGRTRRSSG